MEYFPGHTSIEILKQIQQDQNVRQIDPDQFEERMKFLSMFNDIDWTKKRNSDVCISIAIKISDYAKESPRGHWSFLGPGYEGKWYATCNCRPEGTWNHQANQMIELFGQSGPPVLGGISALSRGTLKRNPGRNTVHFTGDSQNVELIIRTIHSLSKSFQYLRSSDELVYRPFWKDARSRIYCIDCVHFRRKSYRNNRVRTKLVVCQEAHPRQNGAAGNCWQEHSQRCQMLTSEQQLSTVGEETGFIRTV